MNSPVEEHNLALSEEEARKAASPPANRPLDDDDDLSDEVLGERQENACSMEPGCTSCE